MAPPAGQVVLQDGQQVFVEGMEGQQFVQEGQQVLQGGGLLEEGQQLVYAAPEGAEMMYAAAPARVNVSPELFAKLAAGGQMTPEEMAQLSGQ